MTGKIDSGFVAAVAVVAVAAGFFGCSSDGSGRTDGAAGVSGSGGSGGTGGSGGGPSSGGSAGTGGSGGAGGSAGTGGSGGGPSTGGSAGAAGGGGAGGGSGAGGAAGSGGSGGVSGAGGAAGSGGVGGGVTCVDVSGHTWSTPALVEPPTGTDADEGAIGVDASGRAFALLQGDVGASINMRYSVYAPGTGWAAPVPIGSSPISISWTPAVLSNPAGDVLAVYRRNSPTILFWGQFDTQGNSGPGGMTITGDSGALFGGWGISDQGTTLVSYSTLDAGVTKGFASLDYAAGTIVIPGPATTRSGSATLDPDGRGAVFGTTDGVSGSVVPYAPGTGFGALEPMHDSSVEWGLVGGTTLQGGRMIGFLTRVVPPATRQQLFATYRDAAGTWSSPVRVDTGDDSGNPQMRLIDSGTPNVAFIFWQQPDGFYLGRFDGSASVTDVLNVGQTARDWSLATDRCGNAALSYVESSTTIHVRYFVAGTGWTDTTFSGFTSADSSVDLAPTGEGMLLYVQQSQFYFSVLGP